MQNTTPFKTYAMGLIAFVILLPLLIHSQVLATEILIFAMAAIGCNLLLGYSGLLSFGQSLFFGGGAYAASILSINFDVSLLTVIGFTLIVGIALAVLVGFFSIRRQGIYFVMITLAFGQLGYYAAFLAEDFTGGEDGLLDVPRVALKLPFLPDVHFDTDISFYILTSVLFVLSVMLMQLVVNSPFGSVLQAIRQNENRAEAIGYRVKLYKIAIFAFSGAITALSGALYALMLNFAPLSNIDIEISETILFMCVLGGLGSIFGSIVGAAVFLLASDFLSELWPRWMLILGFLVILVMLYARGGLWASLMIMLERAKEILGIKEKHNV
ncbi:MAG: branched-chain amino acid ABC transporter permease [Methylocystaceae bacterium]|nr:branched-chain amino acid ABC transporter permease [Methylocystaceae bacterium]